MTTGFAQGGIIAPPRVFFSRWRTPDRRWWGLREGKRCRIAETDREVNMDPAEVMNSDRKQRQEKGLEGKEINRKGDGGRGLRAGKNAIL